MPGLTSASKRPPACREKDGEKGRECLLAFFRFSRLFFLFSSFLLSVGAALALLKEDDTEIKVRDKDRQREREREKKKRERDEILARSLSLFFSPFFFASLSAISST
jgi:hypothetical protein